MDVDLLYYILKKKLDSFSINIEELLNYLNIDKNNLENNIKIIEKNLYTFEGIFFYKKFEDSINWKTVSNSILDINFIQKFYYNLDWSVLTYFFITHHIKQPKIILDFVYKFKNYVDWEIISNIENNPILYNDIIKKYYYYLKPYFKNIFYMEEYYYEYDLILEFMNINPSVRDWLARKSFNYVKNLELDMYINSFVADLIPIKEINKNPDKVYWPAISSFYNLSEIFIEKHKDKFIWNFIGHQNKLSISWEFLIKHKTIIPWNDNHYIQNRIDTIYDFYEVSEYIKDYIITEEKEFITVPFLISNSKINFYIVNECFIYSKFNSLKNIKILLKIQNLYNYKNWLYILKYAQPTKDFILEHQHDYMYKNVKILKYIFRSPHIDFDFILNKIDWVKVFSYRNKKLFTEYDMVTGYDLEIFKINCIVEYCPYTNIDYILDNLDKINYKSLKKNKSLKNYLMNKKIFNYFKNQIDFIDLY